MRLTALFAVVLAMLALFAGSSHAEPKIPVKKIGKAIMRFTALFAVVLAMLALFAGSSHAEPKIPVKKIGKAIKTGLGVLGAAGTAHEVYENVKNRG
ncbi:unnamed protein product [Chilo suppressalis]|uniref:Virescein n=1 Tax=Chilo suppressalis TaxID=168631 RepID=A0ABN8AZN4_CHISP|nr:unnamed protein product [Chilo suppressalis]